MGAYLYKVMALAARSDGNVDTYEKQILGSYLRYNRELLSMSDIEIKSARNDLESQNEEAIIKDLSENLSNEQKEKAYALAMEVCSINFQILPLEAEFLEKIRTKFGISAKVDRSLTVSRKLRYGF